MPAAAFAQSNIYAGNFPLWLAPQQVRVLTLNDEERLYLAPPKIGKLAELDPAVLVTPPKGMEAGYVPHRHPAGGERLTPA